ncbi:hypothetical protein C8R43DRAFT_1002686 [Mycena crocata]|nr:hypothetical protein C8R43DRAFT_1002686 [Mycena crocata]
MLLHIRSLSWAFKLGRLRFKPNRTHLTFELTLPTELWNIVFLHLSDADLLRTASVCVAFNVLCIGIYLVRYELCSPAVELFSTMLRALQLSCRPPPMEELFCRFWWSYHFFRDLATLRRIIRRSPSLNKLSFNFYSDLFQVHHHTRAYSQRQLLGQFCATLSAMVTKNPGPVVVLHGVSPFVCHSADIAGWRLDAFQFNRARGRRELLARVRRAFGHDPFLPYTAIRRREGGTYKVEALTKLQTADVSFVRDDPGPFGPRYNIVILNVASITLLILGGMDIPVQHLTSILRHPTFPALDHLSLHTDGIDPVVLGNFLLRHLELRTFVYWRLGMWQLPNFIPIKPPIAHPCLVKIEANNADAVRVTMECLHLSPQLNAFDFTYTHTASTNISSLNSTFQLISQRSVECHLDLWILSQKVDTDPTQWPFMDEEAADIARRLHCLRSVKIACWTRDIARMALPWLVLFPALLHVEFTLYSNGFQGKGDAVQARLADFLNEAKLTLSQVPDITGRAF